MSFRFGITETRNYARKYLSFFYTETGLRRGRELRIIIGPISKATRKKGSWNRYVERDFPMYLSSN